MTKLLGIEKQSSRLLKRQGVTHQADNPAKLTAAEQRNMILAMFFDGESDADGFLALVEHCGIDLAACHGDTRQLPNVIAAHYRVAQGRYDIGRAANDLATFPPVAERIAELTEQRLASSSGRRR